MPIEISNHTLSLVKGNAESSSAPSAEQKNRPVNTPAGQDVVAITDAANMLRALEQTLSDLPIVDTQRIAQVSNVVDRESTNFHQMAEKMMSFESSLNRARA